MKYGKLNPYPLIVIAWGTVLFDVIVGIHDWRLWIPLAVVFIERVLAQVVLYQVLAASMRISHEARKAIDSLTKQMAILISRLEQGGNGG